MTARLDARGREKRRRQRDTYPLPFHVRAWEPTGAAGASARAAFYAHNADEGMTRGRWYFARLVSDDSCYGPLNRLRMEIESDLCFVVWVLVRATLFRFAAHKTLFRSLLLPRSRPPPTLLQRRATHVTVRTTPLIRSRSCALDSWSTRRLDPRPSASASRETGVNQDKSRSSFGCIARRGLAGAGDRAVQTAHAGNAADVSLMAHSRTSPARRLRAPRGRWRP